ncbi:hypothetical protein BC832DRAFT_557034 [Gaertneriomyces semiglobifer]|nr:hypothetical protein BC832DRAFT_557034 [Gaertneriomyces semiglobifer]
MPTHRRRITTSAGRRHAKTCFPDTESHVHSDDSDDFIVNMAGIEEVLALVDDNDENTKTTNKVVNADESNSDTADRHSLLNAIQSYGGFPLFIRASMTMKPCVDTFTKLLRALDLWTGVDGVDEREMKDSLLDVFVMFWEGIVGLNAKRDTEKERDVLREFRTRMNDESMLEMFLARYGVSPFILYLLHTSLNHPSSAALALDILDVLRRMMRIQDGKSALFRDGGVDLLLGILQQREAKTGVSVDVETAVLGVLEGVVGCEAIEEYLTPLGHEDETKEPKTQILKKHLLDCSPSLSAHRKALAHVPRVRPPTVTTPPSKITKRESPKQKAPAIPVPIIAPPSPPTVIEVQPPSDEPWTQPHYAVPEDKFAVLPEDEGIRERVQRLVEMLRAKEFHVRAEAVAVSRRLAGHVEFGAKEKHESPEDKREMEKDGNEEWENTVKMWTEALAERLDDDDHIASQAAAALHNLASCERHRPVMSSTTLLRTLINALQSYDIAVLEEVLRVIVLFCEERYISTFTQQRALRPLSVLLHSSNQVGALARFAYTKIVELGRLHIESKVLLQHDPWERVVKGEKSVEVEKVEVEEVTRKQKGRTRRKK